jgi:hypothetical protein
LRRNGGSAITLITTFNLSLENENSENLKWVCEALAMRDRLFTILNFSLENTWGSTITLFTTLRVCEALAMGDRPFYTLHNFP